jgi:hypothetical protein
LGVDSTRCSARTVTQAVALCACAIQFQAAKNHQSDAAAMQACRQSDYITMATAGQSELGMGEIGGAMAGFRPQESMQCTMRG